MGRGVRAGERGEGEGRGVQVGWGEEEEEGVGVFVILFLVCQIKGTSNWSGDYFVTTGGVSLSINQTLTPSNLTVQAQLQEVFERDWFSQYTVGHCTHT